MLKPFIPVTLTLTLACATLYGQTCHGPGKARWPIKTSVPEGTDLTKAGQSIPLDKLLALNDPQGVRHDDPQFRDARIPAFTNPLKVKEGDIVSTTGWLFLVATESDDCDYHIQISTKPRTTTDKPTSDDYCLVVEAPRLDFIGDKDLSSLSGQVRDGIKSKLLADQEPSNSGSGDATSCVRTGTGSALLRRRAPQGRWGKGAAREEGHEFPHALGIASDHGVQDSSASSVSVVGLQHTHGLAAEAVYKTILWRSVDRSA